MGKKFKLILSAFLVICMSFSLVACAGSKKVTKIEMEQMPQLVYQVNATELVLNNATYKATFEDGTTRTYPLLGFETKGFDTSKPGQILITVEFPKDKSITTTFEITVLAESNAQAVIVAIANLPEAAALTITDKASVNAVVVAYEALTETEKAQIDATSLAKFNAVKTRMAEIVAENIPPVPDPVYTYAFTAPTKLAYVYDEAIDLKGAKLAESVDGVFSKDIAVTSVVGYNAKVLGSQVIKFTYNAHDYTFTVTVTNTEKGLAFEEKANAVKNIVIADILPTDKAAIDAAVAALAAAKDNSYIDAALADKVAALSAAYKANENAVANATDLLKLVPNEIAKLTYSQRGTVAKALAAYNAVDADWLTEDLKADKANLDALVAESARLDAAVTALETLIKGLPAAPKGRALVATVQFADRQTILDAYADYLAFVKVSKGWDEALDAALLAKLTDANAYVLKMDAQLVKVSELLAKLGDTIAAVADKTAVETIKTENAKLVDGWALSVAETTKLNNLIAEIATLDSSAAGFVTAINNMVTATTATATKTHNDLLYAEKDAIAKLAADVAAFELTGKGWTVSNKAVVDALVAEIGKKAAGNDPATGLWLAVATTATTYAVANLPTTDTMTVADFDSQNGILAKANAAQMALGAWKAECQDIVDAIVVLFTAKSQLVVSAGAISTDIKALDDAIIAGTKINVLFANQVKVTDIRAAYDTLNALGRGWSGLVGGYAKLEGFEKDIAAQKVAVAMVKDLIDKLPTTVLMSYDDMKAYTDTVAAKNALGDWSAEVANLQTLTDLVAYVEGEQAQALALEARIDVLYKADAVLFAEKAELENIRTDYAALTSFAQAFVKQGALAKLVASEKSFAANMLLVDAAKLAINALPAADAVVYGDKIVSTGVSKIDAARTAYDALPRDWKDAVASIYTKLTACEAEVTRMNNLVTAANKAIADLKAVAVDAATAENKFMFANIDTLAIAKAAIKAVKDEANGWDVLLADHACVAVAEAEIVRMNALVADANAKLALLTTDVQYAEVYTSLGVMTGSAYNQAVIAVQLVVKGWNVDLVDADKLTGAALKIAKMNQLVVDANKAIAALPPVDDVLLPSGQVTTQGLRFADMQVGGKVVLARVAVTLVVDGWAADLSDLTLLNSLEAKAVEYDGIAAGLSASIMALPDYDKFMYSDRSAYDTIMKSYTNLGLKGWDASLSDEAKAKLASITAEIERLNDLAKAMEVKMSALKDSDLYYGVDGAQRKYILELDQSMTLLKSRGWQVTVTNFALLESMVKEIALLDSKAIAIQNRIDAVDINALTYADKAIIDSLRKDYDTFAKDGKGWHEMINNVAKLVDAEAKIKTLGEVIATYAIVKLPTKTIYNYGDTIISLAGATFTGTRVDGTVTNEQAFDSTATAAMKAPLVWGEQVVVVTMGAVTAEFSVTVERNSYAIEYAYDGNAESTFGFALNASKDVATSALALDKNATDVVFTLPETSYLTGFSFANANASYALSADAIKSLVAGKNGQKVTISVAALNYAYAADQGIVISYSFPDGVNPAKVLTFKISVTGSASDSKTAPFGNLNNKYVSLDGTTSIEISADGLKVSLNGAAEVALKDNREITLNSDGTLATDKITLDGKVLEYKSADDTFVYNNVDLYADQVAAVELATDKFWNTFVNKALTTVSDANFNNFYVAIRRAKAGETDGAAISVSVGNDVFVVAKEYVVKEGILYAAIPLLNANAVEGNGLVKVNGCYILATVANMSQINLIGATDNAVAGFDSSVSINGNVITATRQHGASYVSVTFSGISAGARMYGAYTKGNESFFGCEEADGKNSGFIYNHYKDGALMLDELKSRTNTYTYAVVGVGFVKFTVEFTESVKEITPTALISTTVTKLDENIEIRAEAKISELKDKTVTNIIAQLYDGLDATGTVITTTRYTNADLIKFSRIVELASKDVSVTFSNVSCPATVKSYKIFVETVAGYYVISDNL